MYIVSSLAILTLSHQENTTLSLIFSPICIRLPDYIPATSSFLPVLSGKNIPYSISETKTCDTKKPRNGEDRGFLTNQL